MDTGKAVNPEVNDHPFFKVQFLKGPVRFPECKQDVYRTEIFMEVDNEIKILGFEQGEKFCKVFLIQPGSGKERIVLQQGLVLFFRKIMDLRFRELCFQATDYRGGKNNIPN